jgi:hypothetical protein
VVEREKLLVALAPMAMAKLTSTGIYHNADVFRSGAFQLDVHAQKSIHDVTITWSVPADR